MYARTGGEISSSGFEHVFLSEMKYGSPMGLHNWIYFYHKENRTGSQNDVDYKGYMGNLVLGNVCIKFQPSQCFHTWIYMLVCVFSRKDKSSNFECHSEVKRNQSIRCSLEHRLSLTWPFTLFVSKWVRHNAQCRWLEISLQFVLSHSDITTNEWLEPHIQLYRCKCFSSVIVIRIPHCGNKFVKFKQNYAIWILSKIKVNFHHLEKFIFQIETIWSRFESANVNV